MSNPNVSPNTVFAGTTGPQGDRPGPDNFVARLAMYAIALVLFPVAIVVHLTWLGFNQWGRISYKIPGYAAMGLVSITLLVGSFGLNPLGFFIRGYAEWLNDPAGLGSLGEHFPRILLGQIWPGLVVGTVTGAASSWWKWVRRPKYKEVFIAPGPVLKKKAKKNAEDIAKGVNSPTNGITLGIAKDLRDGRFAGGMPGEKWGERVVITDPELAGHTFVVGGSGAGKTQTMLVGIRDVIRRGHGIIFIDCKGGPDVPEKIAEWAHRYGRDFYHWSIHDQNLDYPGPADAPAYYDPISRGDASRRKDLLIGSQRWDVEYYKTVISNYLQTVFKVKDLVPPPDVDRFTDNFTDVADLLDPTTLIHRARYIDAAAHPELASALQRIGSMDEGGKSGIRNMYDRLSTLTSSTAGAWLRVDPTGKRDIDLRRVADEGQVVVFSLDTSRYEETAALIAGLIVQDLKTLSSELRYEPAPAPLHIYVDEFSAVDTTNILGLLNKARDAQMPCTLATQVLADLQRREPTFTEQVLGIVSAFVIHRANAESDARIYAGLSGVIRKTIARTNIQESTGLFGVMGAASSTGSGYLEEREDYAVPVGAFQDLERGQAVFIAKSPDARYVNYVQVIVEDDRFPDAMRDPGIALNRRERITLPPPPRVTYPHPSNVTAPRPVVPPTPAAAPAPQPQADDAAQAPSRPRTSGPQGPVRPGLPADVPVRPSSPGGGGVGRPAGAPLPSVSPREIKPRRNDEKPDEWSGIP